MDYPISIPDQLAPQLRSMRKVRGLNQTELARRMGITQSRIAAIERNPAAVSAGQLLELLKVLGVELVLRDAQTAREGTPPLPAQPSTPPRGEW